MHSKPKKKSIKYLIQILSKTSTLFRCYSSYSDVIKDMYLIQKLLWSGKKTRSELGGIEVRVWGSKHDLYWNSGAIFFAGLFEGHFAGLSPSSLSPAKSPAKRTERCRMCPGSGRLMLRAVARTSTTSLKYTPQAWYSSPTLARSSSFQRGYLHLYFPTLSLFEVHHVVARFRNLETLHFVPALLSPLPGSLVTPAWVLVTTGTLVLSVLRM